MALPVEAESQGLSLEELLIFTIADVHRCSGAKAVVVSDLLVRGVDVQHFDRTQYPGMFPLLVAAAVRDANLVRLLLQAGAAIEQVVPVDSYDDYVSPTALHQACEDGDLAMLKLLLEFADTQSEARDLLAKRNYKGLDGFLLAVASGSVDLVDYLVTIQECDVSVSGADGGNALHVAVASTSDRDMVRYLVKAGVMPAKGDLVGRTPAKLALLRGARDTTFHWILDSIAETQKVTPAIIGLSDLELRIVTGCGGPVEFLDSDLKDEAHDLLHLAAQYASDDVIEEILATRWGRSKVDSYDTMGRTPLLVACQSHNLDAVGVLLSHGADCNKGNQDRGLTPLRNAVLRGAVDLAACLLRHGADVADGCIQHSFREQGKNNSGSCTCSLLDRALFGANSTMAKLLIQAGSTVNSACLKPHTAQWLVGLAAAAEVCWSCDLARTHESHVNRT